MVSDISLCSKPNQISDCKHCKRNPDNTKAGEWQSWTEPELLNMAESTPFFTQIMELTCLDFWEIENEKS